MFDKIKLILAKGLKIILNPPALRNCRIDKTSKVCPRSELTNVNMGRYSYIGGYCFLENVDIGAFCSIAERCCIGGANHPIYRISSSPVFHEGKNILRKNFSKFPAMITPKTTIENDVWIGMGCYIKAGITVHTGAVIGMGSVVTKDIPAYAVAVGSPARVIRYRFSKELREELLESHWWNLELNTLKELSEYIDKPEQFLNEMREHK